MKGTSPNLTSCLLSSCLLSCLYATAQEYSFRNYTGSDGLTNLSVQTIYQDKPGFLWVGTENGLFRYDGSRFDLIGPAQGLPLTGRIAISEDPARHLLIGGAIGLYRQSGQHFDKLDTPFKTISWTQGIQPGHHGQVYLGTDAGLFEMTLQQDKPIFRRLYPAAGAAPQSVYGIFPDGDTLWFGCDTRLCKLQNGNTQTFGEESGLLKVPLVAILKDSQGNLWARERSHGVLVWPAGESRFRLPDTPIPGDTLTGTPSLDRGGRILLGTPDGLLLQDGKGWQLIDRHSGVRGGIFDTFEDRQHSLWMGTGGRGLTQWRGYREWQSYSSASGLPTDNVYELLPQPDGSIWAATEAGLVHGLPGPSGMKWQIVEGTRGVPVHSIQTGSANDLWLSTAAKGVVHFMPATNRLDWFGADQGLTSNVVFTLRFDHARRLWAATQAGLFVADAPYKSFQRVEQLPSTWFWTVTETRDGTLWAGGADGLFALANGNWLHRDHASGLTNQSVVSIGAAPDNSVWVGYEHGGGIDRIRRTATGMQIEHNMQRPGTLGLIYFLNFDRSGHLWAGTERGIDTWDGTHWSHFDTTDGLIWDDCDIGGFAQAPDGSFWFGTSGGLSHFTPRISATPSATVAFTSIRANGRELLEEVSPRLTAGPTAFAVRYAALDRVQNSSLLFRYRLGNADSAWNETTQHALEFANLAPGRYTLEVQVCDRNGLWTTPSATYAFSIAAPWYRRGWFITLLTLLPFLGAAIVVRMLFLRSQAREARLQRIVDQRTNDLRIANEELKQQTLIDPLTGVANRRHFDQALTLECDRATRSGSTVSLLLVDVDHFKALNDAAGHQKGDEYLVLLGRQLQLTARRQIDLVARIGGEEFALILPATNQAEAVQVAEKLRTMVQALNLPHPASPVATSLTVSIGVAAANSKSACSPEHLVSVADKALYQAKKQGRNRVEINM